LTAKAPRRQEKQEWSRRWPPMAADEFEH